VVAEYEAGLLNAIGLKNPGITAALAEVAEFRKQCATPVIVSLFATSPADFARLVEQVTPEVAETGGFC
jgi:dihydroorotate dehydrogenase